MAGIGGSLMKAMKKAGKKKSRSSGRKQTKKEMDDFAKKASRKRRTFGEMTRAAATQFRESAKEGRRTPRSKFPSKPPDFGFENEATKRTRKKAKKTKFRTTVYPY